MTRQTKTQRDIDLAILAAGGYTGWWDETGHPAPWPDDFFTTDTQWRPSSNDTPAHTDGQQPF